MLGKLPPNRRPPVFRAVYSSEVLISTCVIHVILLGVVTAIGFRLRSTLASGVSTEALCLGAAAVLVLFIDFFAWLRAPCRYEVHPGKVVVRRHLGRLEIPLRKDARIETLDTLGALTRSLGNGGLWGVYGKYLSPEKVEYRILVRAAKGPYVSIVSPKRVFILRTDEHAAFLKALEEARVA